MINAISIFLLLGSIQGIILSIFIFLKKKNHIANVYLSISIFFLSISLFVNYGVLKEWHLEFPHLIGVQNIFVFVFIPSLYLYVLLTTQKVKNLTQKHFYHFLPLVAYLITTLPISLQSSATKLNEIQNSVNTFYSIIEGGILNIYPFVYSILMLLLILNYTKRVKSVYADKHQTRLNWLKILIYSLHFAIIISIITFSLRFVISDLPTFIIFFTAIIIVILIYLIGYYALQQPSIFNKELWEIERKKNDNQRKNKEISRTTFDDNQRELILYMAKKKPYKNPELTIKSLSQELSIPVYILSKIINEKLNHNFFSFINQYRINEVKDALKDFANKDEQIIILAYNAGFNSKSTFNSYFKKDTGLSPSLFRKQALTVI